MYHSNSVFILKVVPWNHVILLSFGYVFLNISHKFQVDLKFTCFVILHPIANAFGRIAPLMSD